MKKEIKKQLIEQSNSFSKAQIVLALNCLNDCEKNHKNSINKRFLVELCIMQLCSLTDSVIKKKLSNKDHKNLIRDSLKELERIF